MSTPNTARVDVRLHLDERTLVAELQAALATPLRPRVNASEALRAALRHAHGSMVAQRVAA